MFFQNVVEGPPDAVFGLLSVFNADPRPQKVNLMVGIYKNDLLQNEMIPTVQRLLPEMLSQAVVADYLPMDGCKEMIESLRVLIFGKSLAAGEAGRLYGAQALGGTGALRIGAEFLAQELGRTVFISEQTWPNHRSIFERANFRVETYPYYSRSKKGFDFDGFLASLKKMPAKSVVLLHAACHNPTGCDPTEAEWHEIALVMRERKLLPFFDFAYQGLGLGLEEDAAGLRYFVQAGLESLVAYSCSKNFSLYCQRAGALFVVLSNASCKPKVASQIQRIIRAEYSNPPAFGAWIVARILGSELRLSWEKDLAKMRERLQTMRSEFVKRLMAKKSGADFQNLLHHKGMFSYLDIEKRQAQQLRDQYAIYMLDSGRINVAGINRKNINTITDGICAVL